MQATLPNFIRISCLNVTGIGFNISIENQASMSSFDWALLALMAVTVKTIVLCGGINVPNCLFLGRGLSRKMRFRTKYGSISSPFVTYYMLVLGPYLIMISVRIPLLLLQMYNVHAWLMHFIDKVLHENSKTGVLIQKHPYSLEFLCHCLLILY